MTRTSRSIRRPAYSLLEILLAVGVTSLVMSAVAVSMHTMLSVDRTLKVDAVYGHVMPRLSLQLRRDAHAADTVVLKDEADDTAGMVLTLAAENEVVQYESAAGRVTRTWRRGGEPLGREVYALGKTTQLRWKTLTMPTRLVELEVTRTMGKTDSADSRQTDRIVAAIGIGVPRDNRSSDDATTDDVSVPDAPGTDSDESTAEMTTAAPSTAAPSETSRETEGGSDGTAE